MLDESIDALNLATRDLSVAITALYLAKSKHPKDTYLQGQAREHVWERYWALREAAGDSPKAVDEAASEGSGVASEAYEEKGDGTYVISFCDGPKADTIGFTKTLEPIPAEGGEYRLEEIGTDGDAVYFWHPDGGDGA